MQIVIDIDEDLYDTIKNLEIFITTQRSGKRIINGSIKAIKNGIRLPKGHGRLCDMDAALECLQETADCEIKQYAIGMLDWAMSKRTIIEADKEVENE